MQKILPVIFFYIRMLIKTLVVFGETWIFVEQNNLRVHSTQVRFGQKFIMDFGFIICLAAIEFDDGILV